MRLNLFFSSDNNYAQHLGVAIASLLSNAQTSDELHLYVLDGGISELHKKKIKNLRKIQSFNIEYILQKNQSFEACPLAECTYLSKAAYYRLIIASLKPELERAVYIDVDTVILSSLRELWETDLEANYAGVVEDCGAMILKSDIPQRLGTNQYFNSGMLLLNLKKWRDDKIEERCFDFIKTQGHKICWVDQDVLNHVLSGKVNFVHPKWNLQTHAFTFGKFNFYDQKLIDEAKKNPAIIHYLEPNRPWKENCKLELKSEYLKYLAKYNYRSFLKILYFQKTWPLRCYLEAAQRRILNKVRRVIASPKIS